MQDRNVAWFATERLGLFIHWGLYALDGWHEQAQWRQRIPRSEYVKLAARFNPTAFDPDAWIDLAEAGGMTNITFTTKHHDGFCLWDTDQTDFKVTHTPCGRDLLAELADACHRRDMKLRLYYSVVDWHHPNYPGHGSHHELPAPEAGDRPDRDAYLAYLDAQIEELCTRYGEIHGIWWDMNTMRDHDPDLLRPEVNERIRRWQPKAIINDRGFDDGDFGTPERDWDTSVDTEAGFARPVEACQSVGVQSWGWREDEWYFTPGYLLRSIDKYLAKGANYLLNVGPLPDGSIPAPSAECVRAVGDWYLRVGEAFEGTKPRPGTVADPDVPVTARDGALYLHLTRPPTHNGLDLAPLDAMPRSVCLLNDGRALTAAVGMLPSRWEQARPTLFLKNLPVDEFPHEPLVIQVQF